MESGITKRRAVEIVEEVDAVLANWDIYADANGVPPKLRREIGENMKHAVEW